MSYGELIVDIKEPDVENKNIMHLSPNRLYASKFLCPNVFDKASIKNCSIENITSESLFGIYSSLKPSAKLSITIFQPIEVMIFYDAKQIESNLKLVGFENIKITDITIRDEETGQKIQSQLIEAQKPKGKRKIEINYEEEVETKTKKESNKKINSNLNVEYKKSFFNKSKKEENVKKNDIIANAEKNDDNAKGGKLGYSSRRFRMFNK